MIGTTRSIAVIGRDLVPGLFDLVEVGHVGHRAAGVEVGEDDALVRGGEHVGRLGHEVHTAEDDVGGELVVGREAGEEERVADGVGPTDHLVALVVVTEDDEPVAEGRLGGGDAVDELVVGREGVVVREWSLETQHVGASPLRGNSSSAGGWQPGRQHRGVVGLGARDGNAGYRAGVPSP